MLISKTKNKILIAIKRKYDLLLINFLLKRPVESMFILSTWKICKNMFSTLFLIHQARDKSLLYLFKVFGLGILTGTLKTKMDCSLSSQERERNQNT